MNEWEIGDTVTIPALSWEHGPHGWYKAATECMILSIDESRPNKYELEHRRGLYFCNELPDTTIRFRNKLK